MAVNELAVAMVGSGGDGVVTMGEMLAQSSAREGLNVIKTEAYGPQIRGGETSCTVRISAEPIYAQADEVDILIVFNWADFARFQSEVVASPSAVILYEATDAIPENFRVLPSHNMVPVPFIQLARDHAGVPGAKNIVTLGILAELFGLPAETMRKAVANKFAKKKATVLEANLKGFDAGMDHARGFAVNFSDRKLDYQSSEPKLLMSGNEASAVAAVHAGCRFFAGYPITPSSEILHFVSEWLPRVGGRVVQTEDELAAIGAVIGGSFAGVKSMTATSGPGLSLMSEMIGLSSMAEIPSVIVNVQRGGPSTGIPTKSEQSDLWHAVFASHGDAPRVVLACSDAEDSFHTTVDAFNISEEYQIPVIVLSDQAVAQRRETLSAETLDHVVIDRKVPATDELEGYQRYKITRDGVSPMSIPGMELGMYQTNGLEHDEAGRPNAGFLTHEEMNQKRFRKLWPIRDQYRMVKRYGPKKADVGIICWGSSHGPVREAVIAAAARGQNVAAFVPQMIFPFPKRELEQFLADVDQVVIIELSFQAQFYKYLRTFIDLPRARTHVFKRSGGKNLTVREVIEEIDRVIQPAYEMGEVTL
jgi:2-oxoglutarate ferredoxin oxidoreductase subunit alpha